MDIDTTAGGASIRETHVVVVVVVGRRVVVRDDDVSSLPVRASPAQVRVFSLSLFLSLSIFARGIVVSHIDVSQL